MRAFAALVLAVCACYRPSIPSDVPCGEGDSCPLNQHCDESQSPPTCVPGDGGGFGGSDATAADAPRDGLNSTLPDAFQPDAFVTPIAFVQEAQTKPTTAPTTLTLPGVTSHDAIILCFNFPSSAGVTVVSVADSLGNTFHNPVNDLVDNAEQHYIYYAEGVMGGDDTITLTLSGTVSGADFFALEYSGIAAHFAFDVESDDSNTSTAMSSGSATTTNAHDLILGYAEAPSATAGAGFTARATLSGNLVEDMTVFQTGSYAATATTGAGGWTMIMATFKGE